MKISYRYDALDRLVEVTWADGRRVVYVYDAAGNRLSVGQPESNQSQPATVLSQPAVEPAQTLCPNCGAKLSPGAKFCKQCGARQGNSPGS